MRKYFLLFLLLSGVSFLYSKSNILCHIATSELLPTVIGFVKEENIPQETKAYFERCLKEHKIEIITADEAKALSRSAIADVFRNAQNQNVSPEELKRMVSEDIKYAYNLITFRLAVDSANIIKEISWSVSSWPVNKHTKKSVVHVMPAEMVQQNDWKKTVELTVDSVLNSKLLN